MKSRKLLFSAFIVVALAQLFVPWQMISEQPKFAETGVEYKFKIDSKAKSDNNWAGASIRGKYIWLKFEEDQIKIADKKEWENFQSAYVLLTHDSAGFAKIESATKTKPQNSIEWIRAKTWVHWKDTTTLHLEYPFNMYYFKDTSPKEIESILKNGLSDSLKVNYLSVKIRENQFFVNDLIIDGISFKEMMDKVKKSKPGK